MNTVLNVSNLTKKFGEFTAVDDISFYVKQGEILGLLGANGAGKTTTIQMLLSTMLPTHGSISYFGKSLFTHRSEILEKVSFASTYVRLPGRLSIIENLDIYGQLYGVPYAERKKRIERFLKFFDIWDIRNRESGVLSAGQITRVMLAKAFISHPTMVLLDEPTASLDPDIALEVRKFIREQQQEYGVSILITSHNMAEVTEVCDRVLVMQKGSIIADSSPQKLAASIKNTHLQLLITHNIEQTRAFLEQEKMSYKETNNLVEIEVDEQRIAYVLSNLAQRNVHYDQISIDKPTLEDYFLHIATTSRKNRSL